jgi:hypothetical protein
VIVFTLLNCVPAGAAFISSKHGMARLSTQAFAGRPMAWCVQIGGRLRLTRP